MQKEYSPLKVKLLYPDSIAPTKPTDPTDSGYDVIAHNFKFTYLVQYELTTANGVVMPTPSEKKFEYPVDTESIMLMPGQRVLIGTGIAATTGVAGEDVQVRSRSGNSVKFALVVLNSPGTCDTKYVNEIGVILINHSQVPQLVKKGERIAQIVPSPVNLGEIEIVDELVLDGRGMAGFGSSGK